MEVMCEKKNFILEQILQPTFITSNSHGKGPGKANETIDTLGSNKPNRLWNQTLQCQNALRKLITEQVFSF